MEKVLAHQRRQAAAKMDEIFGPVAVKNAKMAPN